MKIKAKNKRDEQSGFSMIELLIVMGVVIIVSAIAAPKVMTIIQNIRTGGDAHDLNGAILLAKMRASSDYAKTRVYADLTANTFQIDVFPSGAAGWTTEVGSTQTLSNNVNFGFGTLTAPPSGMATLAQAPACLQDDMTTAIANTACIMFNSRGIPIDNTLAPTSVDAFYVTDGKNITGVTVAVTGLTKVWRTDAYAADWMKW